MKQVSIYPTEELEKIMKKPVITAQPNDDIKKAAEVMRDKNVGAIVIVENGKPVGIITERDYVRITAEGHNLDTQIKVVMSTPVITCEAHKKAADAFVLMADKRIDHLPITKNDILVGIVTVRDLFFSW